ARLAHPVPGVVAVRTVRIFFIERFELAYGSIVFAIAHLFKCSEIGLFCRFVIGSCIAAAFFEGLFEGLEPLIKPFMHFLAAAPVALDLMLKQLDLAAQLAYLFLLSLHILDQFET